MLSLTPSHGAAGWNANNHRLKRFLPTDGFPLARLRFSQRSAAPPLQACRGASLTPPPRASARLKGKSARGRAREFGRDSRLHDSILPVAVAMETGECFSPSKLGGALHHIKRRGHDSGCSSTGSPDYSRAKCLQGSVCVRERVQGL